MKKNLQWKVVLTVAVIALAIFLAYPFNDTKIKRGLDLKGGIHLTLQVMTDDSINIETDQEIARLEELFKKNSITFTKATKEGLGRISVQGVLADQEGKTRDLFDEYSRDWDYTFAGDRANLTLKPLVIQFLRDQSVSQAKETIDNRVNGLGVAEPLIQRQGADEIIVELPGVDDPDRVKELIKVTAVLEWKLVKAGPAADEATLLQPYNGAVPDDAEVLKGDPKRGQGGFYLVDKVATVTGKDLRTIRRVTDEWNSPAVSFSLNADGGARFEQLTGANIGKQIAIILDKKVQSAPVVEDRISRAQGGIIRGRFTAQEADDLVVVLKAGALPAGIKYLEERTIGPALGADSIRQGFLAGLVAIVAVMTFMVFFYKLSGLNAIIALLLNVRHPVRRPGLLQGRPDAARHRRHHPGRRHGRRRQRPDLREDQGGAGPGQGRRERGLPGLLAGLHGHLRLQPDDHHLGRLPLPVRHRAHPGLRRDPDDQPRRQPVHGRLRLAPYLRPHGQEIRQEAEYLTCNSSRPPTSGS